MEFNTLCPNWSKAKLHCWLWLQKSFVHLLLRSVTFTKSYCIATTFVWGAKYMWLSIVYYSWPLDSRGPDLGPDCDRNQCGRRGGGTSSYLLRARGRSNWASPSSPLYLMKMEKNGENYITKAAFVCLLIYFTLVTLNVFDTWRWF